MPFIIPFIPLIAAGLGSGVTAAAASGVFSGDSGGSSTDKPTGTPGTLQDIGGRGVANNAILPVLLQALYPGLQKDFGSWLTGKVGQGNTGYPGSVTTDISKTLLPNVYGSYSPWDGGMGFLANSLDKAAKGEKDPGLDFIRQWGGADSAMTPMMKNIAQFGGSTPEVTNPVGALSQFGVSSEGSGRPLADLAYGRNTGAAQYLLPFLTGGVGGYPGYRAPSIPAVNLPYR